MSGDVAPINKMVELIFAARIAKKIEKEKDDVSITFTKVFIINTLNGPFYTGFHNVANLNLMLNVSLTV